MPNTIHPLAWAKIYGVYSILAYLRGFTEPMEARAYLWYIRGPKENIVVDCGGLAGTLTHHGFPSEQIATTEEALARYNLRPEDIDIVICTHLHFDHIENAKLFTRARFVAQKAELAVAYNPHPVTASMYERKLFEGLNFEVVDGCSEVAEGVRVLPTPGHSEGGQSVLVSTGRGQIAISGLCTIQDNFYPPDKSEEAITPGIHTNAVQAYDSVLLLKRISTQVLALHDKYAEQFESIG